LPIHHDPSTIRRAALYGGTFDPVHHGHLILARDAIETLNLDLVLFIPAAISPHKLGSTPTPAELRREMLALAIADEPRFALDESELHRKGPSYTVDTAEVVCNRFPGTELFYLVGSDNVPKLHTWHRFEDLRKLVKFAVLDRDGGSASHDFPTLPRRVDISATEIRERVARGASIRYLVPEPVRHLIEHHRLYR
jgi:nicotinate-nucleotide adenylyltransferase